MEWRIIVSPFAQKQLARIMDRRVQRALDQAILGLKSDPERRGKPLTGKLAGCFSIRAVAQRYRVIYQVRRESNEVVVLTVGLRKEGDRSDIYALTEKIIRTGLITLLCLSVILILPE
jgi:mRNA interferase RelE/StbE